MVVGVVVFMMFLRFAVALIHEILPELRAPLVYTDRVPDDFGRASGCVWELGAFHPVVDPDQQM